MPRPKRKIVFKTRHHETLKNDSGVEDDSKGQERIKKCWANCEKYFNSMPSDLIYDFYLKSLKIDHVRTIPQAVLTMKERFKTVETAEFFLQELATFLEEVNFNMKGGDDNEGDSKPEEDQPRADSSGDPKDQGTQEGDPSTNEPSQSDREEILENGKQGSEEAEEESPPESETESEIKTLPEGADQDMNKDNFIPPKSFDRVIELVKARKNILLVGPSGCGKTFLSEQIAKYFKMNYASISCTEGMSESEFKGWLLPSENGKFEYCESDFVNLYENGGLYCCDEFDAIDANCAIFLNKAVGSSSFHLPQRKGNTLVKRHKDFVFMANANTFGNGVDFVFVGRNQLDTTTLDRFRCGIITMDYDLEIEKKLIDADVLWWGTIVRQALVQLQMTSKYVSTRLLIDFSDMKKLYKWGLKEFYNQFLIDWAVDDRNRLTQVCKQILQGDIDFLKKKIR